jgi:hypothetical protein
MTCTHKYNIIDHYKNQIHKCVMKKYKLVVCLAQNIYWVSCLQIINLIFISLYEYKHTFKTVYLTI